MLMATNFGQDSSCVSDVGLFDLQITDPIILVGQRIMRRLTTPRGGLASIGDDPGFGWDVRQLINARLSPSSIATYQQQIAAECMQDETVSTATATISNSNGTITVSISLASAVGPFSLTLPVQDLTSAQIFTF
jgi:hypothetical protein